MRRTISISVTEFVAAIASVLAPVVRAKPWSGRRPGILLNDAISSLRTLAHRWTVGRRRRHQGKIMQPPSSSEATVVLHFDDVAWRDRDALELIEYYLGRLRPMVEEAGLRFGQESDVLPSDR